MLIQTPQYSKRINRGHPIANGLIAHWRFNEGGGQSVFDAASLTQTLNMGSSKGTWGEGIYLNDASAQHFKITNANLRSDFPGKANTPFSMLIRLKVDFSSMLDLGNIVTKTTGSSGTYYIYTRVSDKRITASLGGASVQSVSELVNGKDHVVVLTFDGTTASWYIDGKFDASGATSITTNSNDFYVGTRDDLTTDRSYRGHIKQLTFWTRALSSHENWHLYRDPNILDRPEQIEIFGEAPAGGGFNPFWAIGSNGVIQNA